MTWLCRMKVNKQRQTIILHGIIRKGRWISSKIRCLFECAWHWLIGSWRIRVVALRKQPGREWMCLLNVLKRDSLSSTCQILFIFICLDRIHSHATTFPILWCCLCKSVWTLELWTDKSNPYFRHYEAVVYHSWTASVLYEKGGPTKLKFALLSVWEQETTLRIEPWIKGEIH